MKVNLMFQDRDFDLKSSLCFGKDTLMTDLGLKHLFSAMSLGDEVVESACQAALFTPLQPIDEILFRQENLRDAFTNPDALRRLYEITVETEKKRRDSWYWLSSSYLSSTFSSAVELLKIYTDMLMELRLVADRSLSGFRSEGFRRLLTTLQSELDDDYFSEVRTHLNELKDGSGTLISAVLGDYLQGVNYVLRRKNSKGFWWRWRIAPSFSIAPRDDSASTDLGVRRDRAINESTNALAQAAEHLEGFFKALRSELAFYVGCLNLADKLQELGLPVCIPDLSPTESKDRLWQNLYDAALALVKGAPITGNELEAKNKLLYIITGANQGGKSTFLRSIGQAQLMAQCGMFVAADCFSAPIRRGVFCHFKKEEDITMESGKLDEELSRMNELANHIKSGALVLLNESFAATNEREGSEICRQITSALADNGVEVFSVTHLSTYAKAFLNSPNIQYLLAQRLESGERTFKVLPGEPLKTAFGQDLFEEIFGERGHEMC